MLKFEPLELKVCWLIQNVKTGDIVLTYQTENGNTKKAIFGNKEQAAKVIEQNLKNGDNYRICRVKK